MNKMKKLLSVFLAVVLALSCMSVMASAAKTDYKSVTALENLNAYSDYGQVTRLSAEARTSMILDFLDNVLPGLNINMGTIDIVVASLYINLTSVDELCKTLNSIAGLSDFLWGLAKGLLGDLKYLDKGAWTKHTDPARDNYAQLTLLTDVISFLAAQTELVENVFDGLELGLVSSFVAGLDLSGINNLVTDLPGLIKGMLFPMFERWDQTLTEVTDLEKAMKGDGGVIETLDWVINNFFTRPMSLTTVKADKDGNMTSGHNLLSTDTERRKFVISADKKSIDVYQYYTQTDVDKSVKAAETDPNAKVRTLGYNMVGTYVLEQEVPPSDDGSYAGSEDWVYVYTETDADGNEWKTTLKHYEPGSYWLPDMVADGTEFHIADETGIALLYKMIPYVFDAMAPVVINGSVQKLLAGLFGVKWENLGLITDEAVLAKVQALPGYDASMEVFAEEQGEYLWEWSAFGYVENGEATNKDDYYFYRFQDQIFVGDASKANDMIEIINWGWNIDGTFMNEFIPGNAAATAAGNSYTHIMMSFNNFLVKAANTVLDYDVLGINAPVWGDNTNLVANVKNVAQAIIKYAPETIFGTSYEGTYYDLITSTGDAASKTEDVQNDLVLTGIAALLIDALAPQAHMPTAASLINQEVKIGGLLAAMLRELATQILPSVDYDALIYATDGYNTNTFLIGKENSYWLDVLLTIGTDLGFKYLRAFADMGEGTDAWTSFCTSANYAENLNKTYAAGDLYITVDGASRPVWEARVDYILDWALTIADNSYTWNMNNFVEEYLKDASGNALTVDMATVQNPWIKLDAILDNLLFLDQFTSETDLEAGLRGTILDLVDLNWGNILGTPSNAGIIDIPANSNLRATNLLKALSLEIRDLINGLFKNVGGGSYEFLPSVTFTDLDALANQTNLKAAISALVGILDDAVANGLLHTILPFLNFFIGWKVDPQVIADPVIRFDNYNGKSYSYLHEAGKISYTWIDFTNNSSGMLEKHRDNTVTDHDYEIVIDSVTNDASINTTLAVDEDNWNEENRVASPYETIKIPLTGTYVADEAVCFTIKYHYVGKDGKNVGGQLTKNVYTFFSNLTEDSDLWGRVSGDEDKDYTGLANFNKFVFTEDIKQTVADYMGTINYKSAASGLVAPDKSFDTITYPDSYTFRSASVGSGCDKKTYENKIGNTNLTQGQKYFTAITDRAEAGWLATITKDDGSTRGYVYKENATGKDTAEEDMPFGDYHIGAVAVKYGSDSKVIDPVFVHYDDHDVDVTLNDYLSKDIDNADIDTTNTAANNAYKAYIDALNEVVRLATYPKKTAYNYYMSTTTDGTTWTTPIGFEGGVATTAEQDYATKITPQIPTAVTALDNAYEALKEYLPGAGEDAAAVGASTADLKAFLDAEAEDEVNFQDYEYYEYFNFADLRTFARNLYNGTIAPEVMDKYYIEGSGISYAELQKVIAAEEAKATDTAKNIAAGIGASKKENDADAIAASQKAHDEFVAPVYTELYLQDLVARLKYYRAFATGDTEATITGHPVAADTKFIAREIQYAEYNYPMSDEALYTEASWARYKDAYDTAKAITGSEKPSEVFSAKYELMVAMKNLLLKEDSANLNYEGYDKLLTAQEAADELLATPYADLVLTADAIAAGYTVDTALAEVVKAYGYYYVGEDGNTWNLYADSVLEYIDNDRPNKSTNWRKMDASSTALNEAVALFEVAGPNKGELKPEAPFEIVVDTTNVAEGYDGILYGIDTLGWNDDFAVDGAITDFFTSEYGDEYVEVVTGDAGVETTGTEINILDKEGNVVETYIFIYFGDVDMDGTVTTSDSAFCDFYEAEYTGIDTMYQFMAADLDGDGWPTTSDSAFMDFYEAEYSGMPYQADAGAVAKDVVYEMI